MNIQNREMKIMLKLIKMLKVLKVLKVRMSIIFNITFIQKKRKYLRMDRDKMQTKLKTLSMKNKKLLESISTHLINNPDQLQSKLHEYRFLDQKYNQLLGFSEQNVGQVQEAQKMLKKKQEEIIKLKIMLSKSEDQVASKVDNIERQHRRKRVKDEEEMENYKQQIKMLKKQLSQTKEKSNNDRIKLEGELETTKRLYQEKILQTQKLQQKVKQIQRNYQEKTKSIEKQKQEQRQKIKELQQLNIQAQKSMKIQTLKEVQASISQFKKRKL